MTTFLPASLDHLDALRRLISVARYSYKNIGDEDLRLIIEKGVVMLAYDGPALWGALGIGLEDRPTTLPSDALNRGSVNVAAFMPGFWPGEWIPLLLDEVVQSFPENSLPLQIASYGPANWMERGLTNAGFEIDAQIVSMALDKLRQPAFIPQSPASSLASSLASLEPSLAPAPELAQLRAATPEDLPAVAVLDAQVFEPLWHFGHSHLLELLWRGQIQLAILDEAIVGYSALLNNSRSEAQLARLAVATGLQGKGIGRQLLADAIENCRKLGYRRLALNTQLSNLRSQKLYTSFGFRQFGEKISVLTKNFY